MIIFKGRQLKAGKKKLYLTKLPDLPGEGQIRRRWGCKGAKSPANCTKYELTTYSTIFLSKPVPHITAKSSEQRRGAWMFELPIDTCWRVSRMFFIWSIFIRFNYIAAHWTSCIARIIQLVLQSLMNSVIRQFWFYCFGVIRMTHRTPYARILWCRRHWVHISPCRTSLKKQWSSYRFFCLFWQMVNILRISDLINNSFNNFPNSIFHILISWYRNKVWNTARANVWDINWWQRVRVLIQICTNFTAIFTYCKRCGFYVDAILTTKWFCCGSI